MGSHTREGLSDSGHLLEVVGRSLAPDLARVHSCAAHPGIADQRRPDGPPGARPPARRSLLAVGMRHRHARSRGSRWAAAVRPLPIIGSRGCLATAWLGAIAPLVDLAHPILYRRLPLLLGRSDVLDLACSFSPSRAQPLLCPSSNKLVRVKSVAKRTCRFPALSEQSILAGRPGRSD